MKASLFLKSIVVMLVFSISSTSCDELFDQADFGDLSEAEVIAALKDALVHGTDTSTTRLSKEDGYFKDAVVKILLPKEAQVVYERLSSIPLLSDIVDETILTINRAAEDAANEAKPIFVDAIKDMTIADGFDILYGEDSAATAYLREKTYTQLFDAFQPKIKTSLSKEIVLGLSAEESYASLIDVYNAASLNGILFAEIKTNSLSTHTTNKALKGLFIKVRDEEKLIRVDPVHRVTDIMQRVFGKLDEE